MRREAEREQKENSERGETSGCEVCEQERNECKGKNYNYLYSKTVFTKTVFEMFTVFTLLPLLYKRKWFFDDCRRYYVVEKGFFSRIDQFSSSQLS